METFRIPRTPTWAHGCIARRNPDVRDAWDLYSTATHEHVGCLVFPADGEYPVYVLGKTSVSCAPVVGPEVAA